MPPLPEQQAREQIDRLLIDCGGTVQDFKAVDLSAGRGIDLVSLVSFALEKQPVLEPFADSVAERFGLWLEQKATKGTKFSDEQVAWLELMRDQIATSVTVEPGDFEFAPFAQRGGLGRAHQLFGSELPSLLDDLNASLVA